MNDKILLNNNELKILRRNKGLSQEATCHALTELKSGVSLSTIKRAESGKQINLRSARLLCNFFGVSIESLLISPLPSSEKHSSIPIPNTPISAKILVLGILITYSDDECIYTKEQLLNSITDELITLNFIVTEKINNYLVAYLHIDKEYANFEVVLKLLGRLENKSPHIFQACMKQTQLHHIGNLERIPEHILSELVSILQNVDTSLLIVDESIAKLTFRSHHLGKALDFNSNYWELNTGRPPSIPFVGRLAELKAIKESLNNALTLKQCFGCLITGPAGIGKSRFRFEFEHNLLPKSFLKIKIRFSENMAPFPLSFLQSIKNNKIPIQSQVMQRLKQKNKQQIVLFIEDIHWADTETIELLINSLLKLENIPILIVITCRDIASLSQSEHYKTLQKFPITNLEIPPLCSNEALTFCQYFSNFSDNYQKNCIEISRGNPLFLEQLLREGRETSEPQPSLNGLIFQRIKHLSDTEKRLLYLIVLCGFRVDIDLLETLNVNTTQLLQSLKSHYLIQSSTERYQVELVHHSIQQAILNSIPTTTKAQLHKYIAERIIIEWPEEQAKYYAIAANNFAEIKLYESAIKYNLIAANYLVKINNYDRAQKILHQSLHFLQHTEDTSQEIKIRLQLATVYKITYGWVSPLISSCYKRINQLIKQSNENKEIAPVLFDAWVARLMSLELKEAKSLAIAHMELSLATNDHVSLMQSHIALSNTLYWLGDIDQANELAQQAYKDYCPIKNVNDISEYGQDSRSIILLIQVLALSLSGYTEKARQVRNNLITLTDKLKHPFSSAIALQASVILEYHLLNQDAVHDQSLALIELCKKHSFPFYLGIGKLFYGWSLMKKGRYTEAMTQMDEGYQRYIVQSGGKLTHSLYCIFKGETYLKLNDSNNALDILEKGIDLSNKLSERVYLSELYRQKSAVYLILINDHKVAKELVIKGKEFANKLGAKLLLQRFEQ
ncbi:MAG: hypothetical protein MJK12_05860 [Colwellia sp.]|nr:hypothetical protein [Colwellia sp.]